MFLDSISEARGVLEEFLGQLFERGESLVKRVKGRIEDLPHADLTRHEMRRALHGFGETLMIGEWVPLVRRKT